MTDTAQRPPTLSQVLLGMFVAAQLLFLIAANVATPLRAVLRTPQPPDQPPTSTPALRAVQAIGTVTDTWGELTLQVQLWAMFPTMPVESPFATVRLVWHAKDSAAAPTVVSLRSSFEPDDPYHFCTLDFFADRLHNYEAHQALLLQGRDAMMVEDVATQRKFLAQWTHFWWKPMLALMRCRLQRYQQEHPATTPPDEVILLYRVYETPPPGTDPWRLRGPVEKELARWRPQAVVADDEVPLAVFDTRRGEFVPVKVMP